MDKNYTNTDFFKITECPSDALLLSYVKNTISKDNRRSVELHLVDCEMCNDMVEGYQRMNPNHIEAHLNSLNSKIDFAAAQHSKKGVITSKFRWYYAAAALLIFGLTGILYNLYFTSIDETKVADLPMPHENKVEIQAEVTTKVEDVKNESPHTPNTETIKSVAPIQAELEESSTNDEIQVFESNKQTEASIPTEEKLADVAAIQKDVVLAEPSAKAIAESDFMWQGKADATTIQPAFTAPISTNSMSQGAAMNFSNITSKESISLDEVKTNKKYLFKPQKKQESDAKYKAKSPTAISKKEDLKGSDDAEKEISTEQPNLLKEASDLMKQQKYSLAIEIYNQQLGYYPTDCEAINGIAQCYEKTNRLSESLANYIKLSQLKCDQLSDEAYLKQAALYVKKNEPNEAKLVLQKAMQSKYLEVAEQAKKELDKLK